MCEIPVVTIRELYIHVYILEIYWVFRATNSSTGNTQI